MGYALLLLHEVGVDGDKEFGVYFWTVAGFGEVYCLAVGDCQFDALFSLCEEGRSVGVHKMAVVYLSQFLVVQIFNKEVKHFLVHLNSGLRLFFAFL